jgi:hypothetical protein
MGWRRPHSSQNPNTRVPDPKDDEKVITWKDPDEEYGLAKREVPAKYRNPGTFASSFKEKLQIGAFMVAKANLEKIDREQPNYPFPTLRRITKRERTCVPKGMSMIYAGTVRVKERARCAGEQVDLEVPKHTFIIPNVGRCIIHDLRLVKHA